MAGPEGAPKQVLLRLEPGMADRVKAVAEVEGTTVSDVIRDAISAHIERRRKDPKFRRQLEESMRRHQRLLSLLEEDDR